MNHINFEAVVWHEPTPDRADVQRDQPVGSDVPGRKFLVEGDAGFHTQTVRIPPDFEAPAHHHDHAELFMVLEGSCLFNSTQMNRYDTMVVEPGESYGFTAGSDGVTFLVTRQAIATFISSEADSTAQAPSTQGSQQ